MLGLKPEPKTLLDCWFWVAPCWLLLAFCPNRLLPPVLLLLLPPPKRLLPPDIAPLVAVFPPNRLGALVVCVPGAELAGVLDCGLFCCPKLKPLLVFPPPNNGVLDPLPGLLPVAPPNRLLPCSPPLVVVPPPNKLPPDAGGCDCGAPNSEPL